MEIINTLLGFIINIISKVIPVFNLSPDFIEKLDDGIALFIKLLEGVSYFIPLDVFVLCFGVILMVDNFALMARIGQFIIKLIRG